MTRLALLFAVAVACTTALGAGAATTAPHVPAVESRQIAAYFGQTYLPAWLPPGYVYARWDPIEGSVGAFGEYLVIVFGNHGRQLRWTVDTPQDSQEYSHGDCVKRPSGRIIRVNGKQIVYSSGAVGQDGDSLSQQEQSDHRLECLQRQRGDTEPHRRIGSRHRLSRSYHRGVGLPAETHMGAVHLTVADLERSLAYYEQQIGLRVLGARRRHCRARHRSHAARPERGGGRTARRRLRGALSFCAARSEPSRPRPLARPRGARPRPAPGALGSRRQRGDLSPRPRPPRHRDLCRPAARALGGRGLGAHDDTPAERRRPLRRARRPGDRAVRRARRTAR